MNREIGDRNSRTRLMNRRRELLKGEESTQYIVEPTSTLQRPRMQKEPPRKRQVSIRPPVNFSCKGTTQSLRPFLLFSLSVVSQTEETLEKLTRFEDKSVLVDFFSSP